MPEKISSKMYSKKYIIDTLKMFLFLLPLLGPTMLLDPIFKRHSIETKLWAKDLIVQHYSHLTDCLLPDKFMELHVAILNLILAHRTDNGRSSNKCAHTNIFCQTCIHPIQFGVTFFCPYHLLLCGKWGNTFICMLCFTCQNKQYQ